MNNKIFKLYITGGIFISVIFCLGILSWAYYNWRSAQNIINKDRIISFTAEGKVVAKPDVALLTVSVITQDTDAKKAQENNNNKMTTVINFLKEMGVKEEDIKTSNYSLNPQYDYNWCRKSLHDNNSCPPKIINYNLIQSLDIKIRDFNKINEIIGGLTKAGANQISDITFTIDDPEQYKNEARIQALNKIKARAQLLSRETGIKIGRIVNISENAYQPVYQSAYNLKDSFTPSLNSSSAAPIEKGSQEIIATVTVSYEIQ